MPYIGPDAEGRGYKSGRIGHVTYKRAGELDDICAGTGVDRQIWYMDAYERGIIDYQEKFQLDEMVFLLHNPLYSSFGVAISGRLSSWRISFSDIPTILSTKRSVGCYAKSASAIDLSLRIFSNHATARCRVRCCGMRLRNFRNCFGCSI